MQEMYLREDGGSDLRNVMEAWWKEGVGSRSTLEYKS